MHKCKGCGIHTCMDSWYRKGEERESMALCRSKMLFSLVCSAWTRCHAVVGGIPQGSRRLYGSDWHAAGWTVLTWRYDKKKREEKCKEYGVPEFNTVCDSLFSTVFAIISCFWDQTTICLMSALQHSHSPNNTLETASPPLAPGYHTSTIVFTFSTAQGMLQNKKGKWVLNTLNRRSHNTLHQHLTTCVQILIQHTHKDSASTIDNELKHMIKTHHSWRRIPDDRTEDGVEQRNVFIFISPIDTIQKWFILFLQLPSSLNHLFSQQKGRQRGVAQYQGQLHRKTSTGIKETYFWQQKASIKPASLLCLWGS